MLKAHKRTLILTSILTILPILVGVYYWDLLPDPMATHFGALGEANGYSSKAFAVFGLPLFLLAMLHLLALVTAKDPKRQNISSKLFRLVLWIIPFVSLVAYVSIYSFNLGYDLDIIRMMEILMGVLFLVIGNYLPKTRQSYTLGIRIPWTLSSEENWNRTHRFAGFLWVMAGIVVILLSIANVLSARWFTIIFFAIALVPCLYSFAIYEKGK